MLCSADLVYSWYWFSSKIILINIIMHLIVATDLEKMLIVGNIHVHPLEIH
jgi:hypothetical protein